VKNASIEWEARIECLCPEYRIADMGLILRRGESVWVSAESARSSVELLLAVRSGAVSVLYARRCLVSRSPSPPNVRMNRAQRSGRAIPWVVQAPVPPEPAAPSAPAAPAAPAVDAGAIEDAIARGVSRAIEGLIKSGALVPGGRPSGPVAGPAPTVAGDAPVYIPSNIVPTGDAATITVAQTSSGGADLDEAAAALKATRRRKSSN
jgi:hypothetical protein